MSSPNIKLQSIIRKYKNGLNETIEKRKIISDYTHQLNINEIYNTKLILNKKNKDEFSYYFPKKNKLEYFSDEEIFKLDSKSENNINIMQEISINKLSNLPKIKIFNQNYNNIYDFIDNNILFNIYNVECCDFEWIISLYFINTLYCNFLDAVNLKLKSLHICNNISSNISAIHHFIYNSKETENLNLNWQWNSINDGYTNNDDLIYQFYPENFIRVINDDISLIDNINIISNKILKKNGKLDYLFINKYNNITNYISYLLLVCKILNKNSVTVIKLPDISMWDTYFINILLLYSLVFQELYIFKIKLSEKYIKYYLVCKNKKKSSDGILFKKIAYLNSNGILNNKYNLFKESLFDENSYKIWLEKLNNIIEDEINNKDNFRSILFDDILNCITNNLKPNINPLLK